MENKVVLKKTFLALSISFLLFIILFLSIDKKYYDKYTYNYNQKVSSIVYKLKEKYPDITNEEISYILNSDEQSKLSDYGIDIEIESISLENDKIKEDKKLAQITLVVVFLIPIVVIIYLYNRRKNKDMYDISKMIEQVSYGKYSLDLDLKGEDELSILKDNLYKITLKLKEEANNSLKDKISLKENLENISHQLKTPLTAISISLDNILDSEKITDAKRKEFLIDIKKEVSNINFFVKSLLDLSRFDANVIKYNRKDNKVSSIINKAIDKVILISELKDIKIDVIGNDYNLLCDSNWEVEALSNIIKNAIEHSSNGSIIKINISENKIYKSIAVSNNGKTIDEEDLNNLFKRFYSGKNISKDSTGIGLSLSKAIIEKDKGKIFVESKDGVTTFIIRYYSE